MGIFSGRKSVAAPMAQALAACRQHLVQAGVFSAFLNLLYLAPTLYMLQVYDRVVPTRGITTLGMLTLIFVFAVFTIAALDLIRTRLLVRASVRLDRRLSGHLLEALLRISRGGSPRSSVALREFDVLKSTITGPGIIAVFDAPWTPIYILVCFILHPALGALAIFGAVMLTLATWLNERATSERFKTANAQSAHSYQAIDESLASAGVVGALGMRSALISRHIRERQGVLKIQSEANFTNADYTSVVKAARLLLQSLALGLGALLAVEQQISMGAIFAASLLVSRSLAPIEMIVGGWKSLAQAKVAYRSISDLLETAGPVATPTHLPRPVGRLAVENLTVATPQRDRPIIQNVSFMLEPGETLGIIGPSGAGKSTLVRALVGAAEIYGGAVRIDGAKLSDWQEEQLGQAIGYVPQEATLFRGTIKENIARFRRDLGVDDETLDAQVVAAAQLCGAHEFILRLPQAYDTQLGPHGAGLSVGQSQRIALARALFGDPTIVIMDEPNASLDQDGEIKLNEALAALRARGVTVILIAHRVAILAEADKLLVMRDGRVDRFGPKGAVLESLQSLPPAPPPAPAKEAGAQEDADTGSEADNSKGFSK